MNNYMVEFLDKTPSSFWETNAATLLISVLGVLLSAGLTYFINKSLNEKNLQVQKDIANKNIDANVTSKARIEWIQKVRILVADIITSLCFFIGKDRYAPKDKIFKEITRIINNINLLKLYLGPDSGDKTDIKNEETNSGKNNEIINFLDVIYEKVQEIETSTLQDSEKISVSLESVSDNSLEQDIKKLANIFRIYLKVEWNKAKNGE